MKLLLENWRKYLNEGEVVDLAARRAARDAPKYRSAKYPNESDVIEFELPDGQTGTAMYLPEEGERHGARAHGIARIVFADDATMSPEDVEDYTDGEILGDFEISSEPKPDTGVSPAERWETLVPEDVKEALRGFVAQARAELDPGRTYNVDVEIEDEPGDAPDAPVRPSHLRRIKQ